MADRRCMRCGEIGQDRRTLWHACGADMANLGIPFERAAVYGSFREQVGTTVIRLFYGFVKPLYRQVIQARQHEYEFYLLTVCKECRGEWLAALRQWYHDAEDRRRMNRCISDDREW